jgi:hypothetical protein
MNFIPSLAICFQIANQKSRSCSKLSKDGRQSDFSENLASLINDYRYPSKRISQLSELLELFIQKIVVKLSKILWDPGKNYPGSQTRGQKGTGSRIRNNAFDFLTFLFHFMLGPYPNPVPTKHHTLILRYLNQALQSLYHNKTYRNVSNVNSNVGLMYVIIISVSDPDSFSPNLDPAFVTEYRSGSNLYPGF